MIELFEAMRERGITPAVATYKREDYALKLLRHFGFDRYTDVMFGGDHENKLKKRDIIEKCINTAGVSDLSRVVMIGDTEFDAVGARDIGVDFIGVSYGFGYRSVDEIKGCGAVGAAQTPMEILKFL
jgi:phosphoglycolate phosphatase